MNLPKPWARLRHTDPEIYELIEMELKRQNNEIELIASENFAHPDVIAAMGNPMNNKYAEGLPGKRYYGGCYVVDRSENLAIERAKALFGCQFANVQPHSGAQANASVMLALLKPGDHILGLDLSHGGHLTHGSKVNFSGSLYHSHFYTLDPVTERIDMNRVREEARAVRPKILIAGASAYSRTIDFQAFREIADEVGALLMVDMAHIAGLVAAGLHPSPIPHAHVVTSTTHKTLRGPRGGLILWNDPELTPILNKGVFPGTQGGPLEHIIAAKATCFLQAQQPDFVDYQRKVVRHAAIFAESLMQQGFKLVSGGTDNHLALLDLSSTEVSGKEFEEALGKVHITVNKNTVPKETRSPFVTSGVRVGTPAMTTRGLEDSDWRAIAEIFGDVYKGIKRSEALDPIQARVHEITSAHPLYPEWM